MSVTISLTFEQCYSHLGQIWTCRALVKRGLQQEIHTEQGRHEHSRTTAKRLSREAVMDTILKRSMIFKHAMSYMDQIIINVNKPTESQRKYYSKQARDEVYTRKQKYPSSELNLIDTPLDMHPISEKIRIDMKIAYPRSRGHYDERYDRDGHDDPPRKLNRKQHEKLNADLEGYMRKRSS
jgi:hypothetical protein